MGQPVWTKLGFNVDDDLMERTVHQEVGPNYFKVYTTLVMKEDLIVDGQVVATKGELMRRDAAPSVLAGPGTKSVQGPMG